MRLSEREKKLLILAFDDAAPVGEAMNALRALLKTWIGKYPDGYTLIQDLEAPEKVVYRDRVVKQESPWGDYELGFGKYRGRMLKEVDPSYLLWCLRNFDGLWEDTRMAIEKYLNL
jgi:hypothetical protein